RRGRGARRLPVRERGRSPGAGQRRDGNARPRRARGGVLVRGGRRSPGGSRLPGARADRPCGRLRRGGGVIRAERRGDVAVLTLDRAEKRNALVPEMLEQLRSAAEAAAAERARAVLLLGEGRAF